MKAVTHITGIHPRSEPLIRLTRRYDRRRASESELVSARARETERFLSFQREAGVPLISHGMFGWQDVFRPVCGSCEGVRAGALTRWFRTNTFFREPVVEGDLVLDEWDDPAFPRGERGMLAILPGAYTFARLARDERYRGVVRLMEAFGSVLHDICRWYIDRGCEHILLSEPSLVVTPPAPREWEALAACLTGLGSGEVDVTLHTYFGDASAILPDALDLPVDGLGMDFFETEMDTLAGYDVGGVRLACGCVDAENSLIEESGDITRFAAGLVDRLDVSSIALVPTTGLEYLPRDVADAKLRSLAEAVPRVEKGVGP